MHLSIGNLKNGTACGNTIVISNDVKILLPTIKYHSLLIWKKYPASSFGLIPIYSLTSDGKKNVITSVVLILVPGVKISN